MFAKGPMPGQTPKQDALAVLPKGTKCVLEERMTIAGYIVYLPDGTAYVSAGSAVDAWHKAHNKWLRNNT